MPGKLYSAIDLASQCADEVLVAFSGGKDSIAVIDLCAQRFKRVTAFFMYLVPELSFQQSYIRYIEDRYKVQVVQLPHFNLARMLKYASYRPHTKQTADLPLMKHGLVSAITWNRRTGNVIGGHQRLGILDSLERGKDYALTVCAVDVDDATEKAQNVLLNNESLAGEYDFDLLGTLATGDDGIDIGVLIDDFGFDRETVDVMFDIETFVPASAVDDESTRVDVETIRALRERRNQFKKDAAKKDDAEFYVVVVFESLTDSAKFLEACGYPDDVRYIDGYKVAMMAGFDIPVPELAPDQPAIGSSTNAIESDGVS